MGPIRLRLGSPPAPDGCIGTQDPGASTARPSPQLPNSLNSKSVPSRSECRSQSPLRLLVPRPPRLRQSPEPDSSPRRACCTVLSAQQQRRLPGGLPALGRCRPPVPGAGRGRILTVVFTEVTPRFTSILQCRWRGPSLGPPRKVSLAPRGPPSGGPAALTATCPVACERDCLPLSCHRLRRVGLLTAVFSARAGPARALRRCSVGEGDCGVPGAAESGARGSGGSASCFLGRESREARASGPPQWRAGKVLGPSCCCPHLSARGRQEAPCFSLAFPPGTETVVSLDLSPPPESAAGPAR